MTVIAARFVVRSTAVGVAAVLASVVLAGCGAGNAKPKAEPTVPLPTVKVNVPAGVTLTKAGAELKFGEAAQVAYEPNPQRSTVLQLTVVSATTGSIADLSTYVLDDRTKASTPYYVRVIVKNLGDGDVGQTPVPLLALDATDTLIQASSFTNSFSKCPSTPLPVTFAPNAQVSTCLVFLVPAHGTLTGLSFRPLQAFAPIVWKGAILPVARPHTAKAGKK